jgi:hypothetical protein
VLPPTTILCDPTQELARANPPSGKDPGALGWGGIDVEWWVSINSMTWECAAVSNEVGRSNSEPRGSRRADLVATCSGRVDPVAIGDRAGKSSGD